MLKTYAKIEMIEGQSSEPTGYQKVCDFSGFICKTAPMQQG